MKRFIYIIVVLMFMLISIGCVTGASEQMGAEQSGLSSTVGRSTFVGEPGMDARGLYRGSMSSY